MTNAALDPQALTRGGRQRDLAAAGYNKRPRHFGTPALDYNAHTVADLRNFGNAAQAAEARDAAQKVNARRSDDNDQGTVRSALHDIAQ